MVRYEIKVNSLDHRMTVSIEGHMRSARDCNALSGVVQALLTYAQNNLNLNIVTQEHGVIIFVCDTNTQLINTLVDYLRLNSVKGDINYE